jgi:hypothetical protein
MFSPEEGVFVPVRKPVNIVQLLPESSIEHLYKESGIFGFGAGNNGGIRRTSLDGASQIGPTVELLSRVTQSAFVLTSFQNWSRQVTAKSGTA